MKEEVQKNDSHSFFKAMRSFSIIRLSLAQQAYRYVMREGKN